MLTAPQIHKPIDNIQMRADCIANFRSQRRWDLCPEGAGMLRVLAAIGTSIPRAWVAREIVTPMIRAIQAHLGEAADHLAEDVDALDLLDEEEVRGEGTALADRILCQMGNLAREASLPGIGRAVHKARNVAAQLSWVDFPDGLANAWRRTWAGGCNGLWPEGPQCAVWRESYNRVTDAWAAYVAAYGAVRVAAILGDEQVSARIADAVRARWPNVPRGLDTRI